MFYAHNLSLTGLQALLNICAKFDFENDIKYNPIKLICMVIKPLGFHLKCSDICMNITNLYLLKRQNI